MGTSYVFEKFVVNGVDVRQNPAQVVMDRDVAVVAHYQVEGNMGTQPLKGELSAQSTVGETVTINITRPNGTIDSLHTVTDNLGGFSITFTDVPGKYSAIAVVEEDADWYAAVSDPFKFDLTKSVRTITLHG
jgi:hypothetical protein